jgi:hypothetical protein
MVKVVAVHRAYICAALNRPQTPVIEKVRSDTNAMLLAMQFVGVTALFIFMCSH